MSRVVAPTKDQERFRQELLALCQKHNADNGADTLLAIAAYAVGQLIAMQDQRRFTSATLMKLVSENIEAGNQFVIAEMFGTTKGNG